MSGSISQKSRSRVEAPRSGNPPRADMWLFSERTAEGVARMVILLSTILSAEPWYPARRQPRRMRVHRMQVHKTGDWAISFRNFFS